MKANFTASATKSRLLLTAVFRYSQSYCLRNSFVLVESVHCDSSKKIILIFEIEIFVSKKHM